MKSKSVKTTMSFLVVVLVLTLLSVGECQAQSRKVQSKTQTPNVAKTAGQKAWLKLLPKMSEGREQRLEVLIDHINEVRRIVRGTLRGTDTNKFVDELLGLEALLKSGDEQRKVESFIANKFSGMVLSTDELIREIQKVYDSFDSENRRITNDFLAKNRIDVDLDPRSIKACKVDTSKIRNQLSQQQAALVKQFYAATKEHLFAVGVGTVAGGFGHQLGYEMGKDQDGNATWMSTILGFAGATATEMMAEEVTLNLMETRKKLGKVTNQAVVSLLTSLSGNGERFEGCDTELIEMFNKHHNLMLSGIAGHLGVDANWANQHLPK